MVDQIYLCPVCHVGWHETAGDWESVQQKGQHFKNAGQKKCPDCAKKDFIRPDPASQG